MCPCDRWRNSLSGLPANIQEDSGGPTSHSPGSPALALPSSPDKRESSPERPPSSSNSHSLAGTGGSKPPSEAGTLSPRQTDSTSPLKSEVKQATDLNSVS